MICVPIVEETVDGMIERANSVDVELVELRLDYLRETSGVHTLAKINKKKIMTCMPSWEGGRFKGKEEERISLLEKTLDFADYVTIELKTNPSVKESLIGAAKKKGVKVIVAFHDFEKTPDREGILEIKGQEEKDGADIAKVAFMPRNHGDVLTLLSVLDENLKIPVIVLSMGDIGKVSRVLGPLMGSYLTFASSGEGKESAPGQLPVNQVRTALKMLK